MKIFRPKNIGVHKASRSDEVQQEDYNRIDKICNLIKLSHSCSSSYDV